MNRKILRGRLLATTIVAGATVLASPAVAQVADQTAPAGTISGAVNSSTAATTSSDGTQAAPDQGEIIVTGSRIPQPNLTSTSPITVVSSQELKLQGTTRIEDLLNSLPQVFADQGGFSNNPSDGTATVNLRSLGAQRTLVLVDGKRLQVGDPITAGGADINIIPDIMVKKIDVLTGGAGSVYGSDAVAGVVNFIMDTDFTGVTVDGQYSLYPHTNNNKAAEALVDAAGDADPKGFTVDGMTRNMSIKIGAATEDGRGHVVGYFNYRKINAVTQGDRDYSACALNEDIDPVTNMSFRACGGSPITAPALVLTGSTVPMANNTYQVGPGSTFVPGYTTYNYAPLNYFQRNDKRYTAGFFAHYDVSDAVKPYAEFMFMDDDSTSHTAAGGDFTDTTTLNCDNPLLAANAGAFAAICGDPTNVTVGADGIARGTAIVGRRNVEGGARSNENRHTDYRGVVGVKGDVAKGVSYDAFFQYGDVQYKQTATNYFSISRLMNALDAVVGPDGTAVCRSGAAGCVPYNIFTGTTTIQATTAAGVTQAALDYLQAPSFITGETTEKVAGGSVTVLGGEYGVQSPWASEGIGLNFGGEYRRETLKIAADSLSSSGDLSGFGSASPPVNNGFSVKEGFVELNVPLISDKPFFHELTLTGGYRYSRYKPEGGVESYKGEVRWAPVADFLFRGGYNRAVRAPNVSELFSPNQVALDGSNDPCATDQMTGKTEFTAAQCANEGVTAAQYGNIKANSSNQYYGQIGGPVDPSTLKPETADTYTAGVVLTPSFLHGFNASVDAYRIKISGLVGTLGEDNILQQCGLTGSAAYCSLIHRDTTPGAVGSLWITKNGYVVDTTTNAGSITTQGIDVAANYIYRTNSWGSLGFSINGTYLDEFKIHNVGAAAFDCAGYYGAKCGTPLPRWRHKARLTWTTPWNVSLSGEWRFIGRTKADALSSNPLLASTDYTVDDKIKNYSYFDLVATARVMDKLSLRIGAQNILDKDPPVLGSVYAPSGSLGGGNTFPQVYDVLGRYVFMGFSIDL